MTTWLFTHPACLAHEMGPHHPESPARLRAILAALEAAEFAPLVRHEAPAATVDSLAFVHDRGFVEAVLAAIPKAGIVALDPDTSVSSGSGEAALRAAGAVVAAGDAVLAGKAGNALCAGRPPRHHAAARPPLGLFPFYNLPRAAA